MPRWSSPLHQESAALPWERCKWITYWVPGAVPYTPALDPSLEELRPLLAALGGLTLTLRTRYSGGHWRAKPHLRAPVLVAWLHKNPGSTYQDMLKGLYPQAERARLVKARNALAAMCCGLKNKGLIRSELTEEGKQRFFAKAMLPMVNITNGEEPTMLRVEGELRVNAGMDDRKAQADALCAKLQALGFWPQSCYDFEKPRASYTRSRVTRRDVFDCIRLGEHATPETIAAELFPEEQHNAVLLQRARNRVRVHVRVLLRLGRVRREAGFLKVAPQG